MSTGQNASQSLASAFARQGGLATPVHRLAQVDTMGTTVPRSAHVKMAPRVITCWAHAFVRLDGPVTIAHKDASKVSSVPDVLRDVSVAMVMESHVMP